MTSTREHRIHEPASGDAHAMAATHERVLRVLGLSQRPLQSGELQNALGLVPNETTQVCEWLTDRGYISAVERRDRASAVERGCASVAERGRAAHQAMKQWALAEKGRSWAEGRGALVAQEPSPQEPIQEPDLSP